MKKYMQLIITIANFIAISTLIALTIPTIVPIHFGITGQADSWSSKWVYLIFAFIPVLLEIIYLLYSRNREHLNAHNHPYERRVTVVVEYIFVIINWGLLSLINMGTTQVSPEKLALITSLIMGLMLIIMCNIYGKIKQNRYFGVRTKATLADERVWNLTNRMSGYIGFAAGIVLVIWGIVNYIFNLVSPTAALIILLTTTMGAAAAAPYIVSNYYAKKLSER